eukprot:UN25662
MWLLPMFEITTNNGTLFFTSLNPRGQTCEIIVLNNSFTGCWAIDGQSWNTEEHTMFTFINAVLVEDSGIENVYIRIQGMGESDGWHQKYFESDSEWEYGGFGTPVSRMKHTVDVQRPFNEEYDSPNMYIFGGYHGTYDESLLPHHAYPMNKTVFLNDLWKISLNGDTWENLDTRGLIETSDIFTTIYTHSNDAPSPRAGHVMFIIEDIIWIFGGYSYNKFYSDVWRYNTTLNMWCKHEPRGYNENDWPTPRAGHSWTYHKVSKRLYMFGGYGYETNNEERLWRQSKDHIFYNDLWYLGFNDCINDCSGNGRCHYQYCICDEGHFGDHCQHEACPDTVCIY